MSPEAIAEATAMFFEDISGTEGLTKFCEWVVAQHEVNLAMRRYPEMPEPSARVRAQTDVLAEMRRRGWKWQDAAEALGVGETLMRERGWPRDERYWTWERENFEKPLNHDGSRFVEVRAS